MCGDGAQWNGGRERRDGRRRRGGQRRQTSERQRKRHRRWAQHRRGRAQRHDGHSEWRRRGEGGDGDGEVRCLPSPLSASSAAAERRGGGCGRWPLLLRPPQRRLHLHGDARPAHLQQLRAAAVVHAVVEQVPGLEELIDLVQRSEVSVQELAHGGEAEVGGRVATVRGQHPVPVVLVLLTGARQSWWGSGSWRSASGASACCGAAGSGARLLRGRGTARRGHRGGRGGREELREEPPLDAMNGVHAEPRRAGGNGEGWRRRDSGRGGCQS